MTQETLQRARRIGRYLICGELAAGGMATVHIGRLLGPVGFARTVAIKRLHPQFAKDPEFVSMFLDEARLAARIRHPNVVPVLDVVAADGELFLVMDFVIGESISRLAKVKAVAREGIPVRVAVAIVCGALQGLHAAHETRGEKGDALGIVHRDISPQNILLGNDGAARLIDFGIAKAMGRVHASQSGQLKGKLPYMAPEHVRGDATRQSDVFSSGIVLWELLTGKRLFAAESEVATFSNVLQAPIPRPSDVRSSAMLGGVDPSSMRKLDDAVMKALERDVTKRFNTAREFAVALERAVSPASTLEVSEWMERSAGEVLRSRAERVAEIEELTTGSRATSYASIASALAEPGISEATAVLPLNSSHTPAVPLPVAAAAPVEQPTTGRTEISHVTSHSTSQLYVVPAPRPVWKYAVVAAALCAVAVAIVGVVVSTRDKNDPDPRTLANTGQPSALPSGQLPVAAQSSPSTAAALDPSAVPVSPPTIANAAATPTTNVPTTVPTSVPQATSATRYKPPVRPPSPTTSGASAGSGSKNPRCNPNYEIDASGRKHFKPECF